MKKMITRRNFLKAAGVSPLLWVWLPAAVLPAAPLPLPPVLPLLPAPLQRQTARSTT